jgi:peptide/nickel transport system permease protein
MTELAAPTPTVAPPSARRGPHPLVRYAFRRVLAGIVTLFVVSILVFIGTEMLPGDAASAVLGRSAGPTELADMRELMGLDKPAVERYADWLGGLLRGDLGNSAAGYAAGGEVPIWGEIDNKIVNSFILAALTTLFMIPLSLLLGTIAATRAGRSADHGISLTALGLQALPEFVVGSLLIVVFFTWLDLLPPVALIPPGESPLSYPKALVLPVLTLLAATLAGCTRMIRASTVETLRSDYVQMARLNGLPERRVVSRYALRNALAPSIQVFAQNIQYLFGGIIIVEYLFAYPGLGKEFVDAVAIRDVREVQSIAILIAAFYIFVNIVADLLVVMVVPKLRTGNA